MVDVEIILLLRLPKFYSNQKTEQLVLMHFSFESENKIERKMHSGLILQ